MLDSIVKNVGTPYTIFFGRQLYQVFMEAYSVVDNNTRRKMEEMLQTWKQAVPGSIDTRPVFPQEAVRPIENALLKAKTSMLRAEQEHMRSQQQLLGRGRPGPGPQVQGTEWRQTPTPPGAKLMAPAPTQMAQPQHQYTAGAYDQPINPGYPNQGNPALSVCRPRTNLLLPMSFPLTGS